MKKTISIVLVLSIIAGIFAMCGVTAFAEYNSAYSLYYSIIDGEAQIRDCNYMISGDFIIPETIDGYPVTSIADEAFYSAQKVTSFTIPASVKTIGKKAFVDCIRLEEFIVDENNEYFTNDEYGVLFNKDKTELIMYPDATTITDYIIPESVVTVADYAFRYCINLETLSIPATVETFGDISDICYNPFESCNKLKVITVDEANQHFTSDDFGALFNKDMSILIKYPAKSAFTEYSVPSDVKTILIDAFGFASNLEKLVVPNTVTAVGDSAFRYMENVKTIEFNANTEILEDFVFMGCYSLENLELSHNVKTIDYNVFTYCNSLKNLVIPEGVETLIGSFIGCFGIESVTLPDSVTALECGVFGDCIYLENVNIPASVKKLTNGLFYNCYSLDNVVIPATVEEIEENAIRNCHSLNDIYIYNPDVIINERAIGYVDEKIDNLDEYKRLLREATVRSIMLYCQGEEDDAVVNDLYEQSEKLKTDLDETAKCENTVIHGYKGSTAEVYADTYGFPFVPICDHINKETINAVDADCKNDGYSGDVYCYDCKKIIENGEIVPSTGHNYVDTVITAPTYTQVGEGGMVCEHCGDIESTYEIPLLEIEDSEEKEDADTGVSVIFPDDAFDGEAEIEVTPVEEGEAFKLISHKQGNYKVTMFDINVTVDGQKVQPNGTVLVKIPLPKGYNQNKCVVYYVADDGTMEELKTYHYKDGYVYFETDHFSYYAVLEDVETSSEDNNENINPLRQLLNYFIDAFYKFIAFFKSIFGIA